MDKFGNRVPCSVFGVRVMRDVSLLLLLLLLVLLLLLRPVVPLVSRGCPVHFSYVAVSSVHFNLFIFFFFAFFIFSHLCPPFFHAFHF